MYSLNSIFKKTIHNLHDYWPSLFILHLTFAIVTAVATHFVQTATHVFLILLPFFILTSTCACILTILTYQIIENGSVDFLSALNLFFRKFIKLFWISIAAGGMCVKSLFPWILPFFTTTVCLIFTQLIILFEENDTTIDVTKKSFAIAGKDSLAIIGIGVVCALPSFSQIILGKFIDSNMNILTNVFTNLFFTLTWYTFLITIWKTRSISVTVEPEIAPINYKKWQLNLF